MAAGLWGTGLPFTFGVITGSIVSTQVLPRFGARIPMSLGLAVAAAGTILLTQLGPATNYWSGILPAQVVISVGLNLAGEEFAERGSRPQPVKVALAHMRLQRGRQGDQREIASSPEDRFGGVGVALHVPVHLRPPLR